MPLTGLVNLGQTYKRAQLSPLFQPAVLSQGTFFPLLWLDYIVCFVAFVLVGTVVCLDFWFVEFKVRAVCGKSKGSTCLLDVLV